MTGLNNPSISPSLTHLCFSPFPHHPFLPSFIPPSFISFSYLPYIGVVKAKLCAFHCMTASLGDLQFPPFPPPPPS